MVTMSFDSGTLTLTMEGAAKVLALKSKLEIPVAHISSVQLVPDAFELPKGIKLGGASIPNVIRAGTFVYEGDKVFWDVRDPSKAIMIGLLDEEFGSVVVEVADPATTVAEIQAYIV